MDKNNKKTIAVIFGGCSPEYEVSLKSAYAIISNINTELYHLLMIGITQEGKWFKFCGPHQWILDDTWYIAGNCCPAIISPDRSAQGLVQFTDKGLRTTKIDAAFPVMHGKNGEDGTLQGLLELAGIPIIGCHTLASAIGMDKQIAHTLVEASGIAVPKSIVISKDISEEEIQTQIQSLNYPIFIKPVRAGSSFGITKVTSYDQLMPAIANAALHDERIIVEEAVEGFEVGCAILGTGKDLVIGEVDEIQLEDGFFDYTEKYSLKTSQIIVPARISPEKAQEIKSTAAAIYRILQCSGFARVDLFMTPDGTLYFNEINTIPGFTEHSRYPNMLKKTGMSFSQIVEQLIYLVVKE